MLLRVCIKCGEIFGCKDENGNILCKDCKYLNSCTYKNEFFDTPSCEIAEFITLGVCPECTYLFRMVRR